MYREAPLNAIWEGAGNVIALDVIRALQRSPQAGDAFVNELELARGTDRTFDQALDRLKEALSMSDPSAWDESEARRLVEQLAVCWGASLCLRH